MKGRCQGTSTYLMGAKIVEPGQNLPGGFAAEVMLEILSYTWSQSQRSNLLNLQVRDSRLSIVWRMISLLLMLKKRGKTYNA